ncbi:MAG: beta-propeller domain-containing protein [Thermoplasmata archaeon]
MKINSGVAVIVAAFVTVAGLTAGISAYLIIYGTENTTGDFMSSFSSYDDLAGYLDQVYASVYGPNASGGFYYGFGFAGSADKEYQSRLGGGSLDYSKTNVQVEGVDEADIVKTNGELIFVSSSNSVAIVKAYPPEKMQVLSYVNTSDFIDNSSVRGHIEGIYINDDNLVLVLSCYKVYSYDDVKPGSSGFYSYWYYYSSGNTMLAIFDVSDPTSPSLRQKVEISGYPIGSRMIGDTVYSISQSYIWKIDETYCLPEITVDKDTSAVSARDIYYDPNATLPNSFLSIIAVDVVGLKHDYLTIMADYSSTIYMSESALYLTFQKWKEYLRTLAEDTTAANESVCTTTIYKIEVDKLWMAVTARGDVSGYPLNQFALDEHDGYLRIATTDGFWRDQRNAVYVLDDDLQIVGSLENIAPAERIYSSRFVGDVLYLVTFRQTDPLFVIDLSDPSEPRILGEIELPGFSTYLHPIDGDHLLGIGIENGSVKISLFDVSDPTAPSEKFRYLTERSSYSEANWDHKAILFDAKKELLVIPMTEYSYTSTDIYNYTYEMTSGACVFRVSVDGGIELRGVIDHSTSIVRRALYIGNYLYTISECFVKANQLSDLSLVSSVEYYTPQYYEDWYGYRID